jgi:drug/metabolite transporter (DMT)-like permease
MITQVLPSAAAAGSAILVGATMVATRFAIQQSSPASLALLRYLIGFCCLLPPALMTKRVRLERRDLLPIGILGIIQFAVVIALLNYALQSIPAVRSSLIFATSPLLTMLLAAALGHERLTWAKAAGVLLSVAGVGLALGEGVLHPGSSGHAWAGDLAVFGSALSAAVCSVLYRPYLRKYPVLPVSAFAMFASVLFLAILSAGEGFFRALPHFTGGGWLAVGFIGVSSGVGYYLWLWALRHTSPTRVTVFLALGPVTAMALGATLLGESVSATFLVGLTLTALGLVLAHREAPRTRGAMAHE